MNNVVIKVEGYNIQGQNTCNLTVLKEHHNQVSILTKVKCSIKMCMVITAIYMKLLVLVKYYLPLQTSK